MAKRKLHASFIPWRFYLLISVILLVVIGLIARLFDLAILDRHFLQGEGNARALRVISTPAFRGMITDRNGYPLAVSTTVYSAWANPQGFSASSEKLQDLAGLLETNPTTIEKLIQQQKIKHREFFYLKRSLSPEIADKIKKLKIAGVFLQEDYKRYYPEAEVAAHVIGFTNIDDKGQEGLELSYNDWLSGTSGKIRVIKDRLGRAISNLQTLQEQKPGHDLALSIDRRIQYLAYRELLQGVEKNLASSGSVIVLDVKTGEILAMVNQPSFNPNNRVNNKKDAYRNRAVTDIFEPGSTLKAFSVASGIDSRLFRSSTIIDTTPGWMRVGRGVVRDEHNNGPITLSEVLQVSSNVGVTKMILSLQPGQLYNLLHRVGFGEQTGVGFPGEQGGVLINRANWKPFALATLAFGYGVSVTPLQLAQAYSIFGNKGVKLPVSLLKLDKLPKGERVMEESVATQMLTMLETVTTAKRGTGTQAQVPGYHVAGKTGTAFIAGPHGYDKHRVISSFVGVAPVSDPRLVVAVIIQEPKGKNHLGGLVSAPVFEKIMEGALRIFNIPPDYLDDPKLVKDNKLPVTKEVPLTELDPFENDG